MNDVFFSIGAMALRLKGMCLENNYHGDNEGEYQWKECNGQVTWLDLNGNRVIVSTCFMSCE